LGVLSAIGWHGNLPKLDELHALRGVTRQLWQVSRRVLTRPYVSCAPATGPHIERVRASTTGCPTYTLRDRPHGIACCTSCTNSVRHALASKTGRSMGPIGGRGKVPFEPGSLTRRPTGGWDPSWVSLRTTVRHDEGRMVSFFLADVRSVVLFYSCEDICP